MKKKLILTIALLFVGVFSFSVSASSSRFTFNGTNYSVVVDVDYIETLSNGVVYDVSVSVQNLQPEKWVISSQFLSLTFSGNGTNYQVYDSYDCAPYVSSYGVLSLYPEGNIVLAPGEMKQYHFKLLVVGTSSTAITVTAGSFPGSFAYSFDDLLVLPADELAYLAQSNSILSNIYDVVSYNGNFPAYNLGSGLNSSTGTVQFTNSNGGSTGIRASAYLRYLPPVYLSADYELDGLSDTTQVVGTVRYTGILFLRLWNTFASTQYKTSYYLNVGNVFPNDLYPVIDTFSSNLFGYQQKANQNLYLFFKHTDYTDAFIQPHLNEYTYLVFHYDIPARSSFPSFPSVSIDGSSALGSIVVDNGSYMPVDEFHILRDIYQAFANSDRSDQDQLSSDITSTSNSIHTQEEQYFSSNAQAIQATGLSNYRFDQNQTGGISAVSNDFTDVFNALGGFNSVFIFSMTLSLALQIFRHHPIVFRAKQVNTTPKVGKGGP